MDDTYAYQRWYGETHLNPVGFVAMILLGIALLILPRRLAVWPMLIMACFVSPAQQIAVMGLNFDLMRILILFGTVRVLLRWEWTSLRWSKIDTVFVFYVISACMAYWVLHNGDATALKFKLGTSYDAVGTYFLFRCLIRGPGDVLEVGFAVAVISVPVAICFLIEVSTAHNMFAIFGGVREITWVRMGRLRCQGAFAHAILAGCFFATLMPFVYLIWMSGGRRRVWGAIGIGCSLIIIVTCASSTPVAGVFCCVFGALLFRFRRLLPVIRISGVVLLVMLHLVMKQPVWHLLSRVDFTGGSTGYQRFLLADAAIRHFGEWYRCGIISTASWGGECLDITNQFVLEGIRGGVITLALFILLIVVLFSEIGKLCRRVEGDRTRLFISWGLGVALFAHCMIFLALSYFGQMVFVWYLTLAIIGSLVKAPVRKRRSAARKVSRPGGLGASWTSPSRALNRFQGGLIR